MGMVSAVTPSGEELKRAVQFLVAPKIRAGRIRYMKTILKIIIWHDRWSGNVYFPEFQIVSCRA